MRKKLYLLPLVALLLAALACGGGAISSSNTPVPSGPKVLLKDDFSSTSSGWDTGSDTDSSVDYAGGEYVIKIEKTKLLVWGTQNEEQLGNVHIAVKAQNTGAADPTFGVLCGYKDDKNFYYMGLGVDAYYAIAKYVDDTLTIMTSDNNQWIQSDAIKQNADSYKIEADCGNGRLALYVDGKQIASVEDPDYSKGNVGLFGRSFDNSGVEVHFDDFVVTELK
jgi:hypothetical protein